MRSADLHRLSRQLREIALAASGEPGERPTFGEIAVVEDLARNGPAPVGLIAERSGVAQSLVSKVVVGLVEARIATTGPDPHDGRRRVVALADGVRDELLRPRGERPVRDAVRAAAPALDDDGVRRVESLLVELTELLDPHR